VDDVSHYCYTHIHNEVLLLYIYITYLLFSTLTPHKYVSAFKYDIDFINAKEILSIQSALFAFQDIHRRNLEKKKKH